MENVTQALFMAFAMFVLVMALAYSMHMISSLNYTSKTIMHNLDKTNQSQSIELKELVDMNKDIKKTRTVGIDTIIPTLYRYYKESYSVRILDEDGNLMQYFDTTTEGEVMTASNTLNKTEKQKALLSLYGTSSEPGYLYSAPWMGNTNKDTKARIDMYISGAAGYINNVYVNYKKEYSHIQNSASKKYIYLNYYKNRLFKETFVQYAYEGDTLTTEDDELVSLTGSKQIATKIIITYQLLPI